MEKNEKNDIQVLPDSVPTVDAKKTFLGTVIFLVVMAVVYSCLIRTPKSFHKFIIMGPLDILCILLIIEAGIIILNIVLRISRKKRRYQSVRNRRKGKDAP